MGRPPTFWGPTPSVPLSLQTCARWKKVNSSTERRTLPIGQRVMYDPAAATAAAAIVNNL